MMTIAELYALNQNPFALFKSAYYLFATHEPCYGPAFYFGSPDPTRNDTGARISARILTMSRTGPHISVTDTVKTYHIFPTTAQDARELDALCTYASDTITDQRIVAQMMHTLRRAFGDRPVKDARHLAYTTTIHGRMRKHQTSTAQVVLSLQALTDATITNILIDISDKGGRFTVNGTEMTGNTTPYTLTHQTLRHYLQGLAP